MSAITRWDDGVLHHCWVPTFCTRPCVLCICTKQLIRQYTCYSLQCYSSALEGAGEWCSHRLETHAPTPTAAKAGGTPVAGSISSRVWEGLMHGGMPVSPHLPLNRTAAAFIQGAHTDSVNFAPPLHSVCVIPARFARL